MEEYLKYGDLISINLSESLYIHSKGLIDTSVNLVDLLNQDFSPAVFRVFPQTIHSVQKEILTATRSISEFKLTETLARVKESAEGEIKTNLQIYSNFLSQPVKFNSLIQLQHVSSAKFLSISSSENAEIEKDNLKLTVNDFFSDASLIRVLPAYKYQTEGTALVKYKDCVYLEITIPGTAKTSYVHCSNLETVKEVNCSMDVRTKWRIQHFSSIHTNDKLLYGDHIWLTHSELLTSIVAKRNSLYFSDFIHDTNGIWKIEGEVEKPGEILKSSTTCRLKHLSSGKYLSLKSKQKAGKSKEKIGLSKKISLSSMWKIIHIYSKKSFEKDDLCMIVNCKTAGLLDGIFTKEKPILSGKASETSYFKMFRCEDALIQQAVMLVNCKGPLAEFLEMAAMNLHDLDKKKILKLCEKMNECLKILNFYCKNKLIGMIDTQKQFGQVKILHQKRIFEQDFIDLFAKILSQLKIEQIYQKAQDSKSISFHKLLDTIKNIFQLLIKICEQNSETQIYAYSFIEIFQRYVNYIEESTSFISAILDSNHTLLYTISKPPSMLIQNYTKLLRINFASRKPHLVQFLQSICVFSDKAIKLTQEKIHEMLFGNPETFSKVVINTISNDGYLSVLLPGPNGEQAVLLDSCFVDGVLEDSKKIEINYFYRLLELFADMCKDRNYTCKASLKDWFPVQVLIRYMWDTNLSSEMRSSFVRLMHSMHVDSHPRHEERYPEAVKVLNLQSKIDPFLNYKNSFSLLAMEISIKSIYKNAKKYTVFKKNRDSAIPLEIVFSQDELILYKLKEDLIAYIKTLSEFPEFNVFTYQVIVLASHLVRLKIIDHAFSISSQNAAILNPSDKRFKYEELDITKLLKALLEILFFEKETNFIKRTGMKPSKGKKEEIGEISEKIFSTAQDSAMAEALKKFRNYVKSALAIENIETGYENSCKIEICKLLEFMLSWRLDYLVNNVIEWFNSTPNSLDPSQFLLLLPKVPFGSPSLKKSDFQQFLQPEVKDLNFYGQEVITKLLQQFINSQDFQYKTLLLSIILKTFSMRALLLKQLMKIQVVTTIENSNIYMWIKEKLVFIKQFTEQSEVWLNYWNEPQSNHKVNEEKISLLGNIFREIIQSLDIGSHINDGVLEPGFTGTIDKNRQNTYYNLYLHEFLISLLQDSLQTLSHLYTFSASPLQHEAKNRFIELFQNCHELLAKLAIKNKKIQELLFQHQQLILSYLHLPLGQIDLLCNMYSENWELCKKVDEKFVKCFVDLIYKYGRQVKFLKIFTMIQSVKNEFLRENQRMIVKVLLEGDYSHICFMDPGCKSFSMLPKEGYLDEPYEYHAKLLEIFALSADGSSGVYLTEMKCQKFLSIEYLFKLLEKRHESQYNLLYIPLLKFYFHVYIDVEKAHEMVINTPFLKNLILDLADELKQKQDFSNDDFAEIEIFIEILFKFNSLYCVGDVFYSTYDDIRFYLLKILEKYEFISEVQILYKTIEKIEILGYKYQVNFPPTIQDNLNQSENHRRLSHNPIRNTWVEFKLAIAHCQDLKKYLAEEQAELIEISLQVQNLENKNGLIMSLLDYLNNYTLNPPQAKLLNKTLKFMAYFLSKCSKKSKELAGQIISDLNDRGIISTIMALLCDSTTSQKTLIYLLKFSCELLSGGILTVQNSFFMHFSTNATTQLFFSRLSTYFTTYPSTLRDKWEKITPIYQKKSFHCKIILEFLQLLCENHNQDLQNYMRLQFNSRRSFNLLKNIVFLLEELLKKSYNHQFLVVSQCFDTISEMIQGPCKPNQICLTDSTFLEISGRLLSFDEKSDSMAKYQLLKEEILSTTGSRDEYSVNCLKGWMLAHLKYKCLVTLHSLLEGQTGNYVITRMIRSLSLEILKENILSFYFSYTEQYKKDYYDYDIFGHYEKNEKYHPENPEIQEDNPEFYQNIIEVGFLVYHLMSHFKDNDDPDNKRIIKNELPDFLLLEEKKSFFGAKLIGDLGKIGFGLLKTGFNAAANVISKKKARVEITEFEKKKLLTAAYEFFQKNTGNIEALYSEEVFRIYFWIRPEGHHLTSEQKENFHFYVDRSSDKFKILYLVMKADELIEEIEHGFKLSKIFNKYKILALIASNVTVWKELAFVMTLALNFIIISSYAEINNQRFGSSPAFFYEVTNTNITLSLLKVFGIIQMACSCCIVAFFLIKTAPVLIARGWRRHQVEINTTNKCIRLFQMIKNGALTVYFALSTIDVLYQLGYLAFSVLGTAIHPFFFAFHLLDVMYRYPALQNVIKSIMIPRKSLMLSFILILILIYLFSIWSFIKFSGDFDNDCNSMLSCLKVEFDEGLKSGGGIGDYLNNISDVYIAKDKIERLINDTLFFIIVIIIMLGIIQGIIVDAFASLREVNDMNAEDMENKCFICGLQKQYIEYSTNRSFKFHTTNEHCEWNYLLFINYLKKKDPSERTGMESYIFEKLKKNECSWIPQRRSLSIKEEETEEDEVRKKVEKVDEIYKILDLEMKDIKKCFNEYLESKHIAH